jgi:hypothetical protein
LKLHNYEEALKVDPAVGKWIQVAQTAAMGSHPGILEDDSELPKTCDPHAEEGGEALEWMYAAGRTSLEESRISGRSGIAGIAGGQVAKAQT